MSPLKERRREGDAGRKWYYDITVVLTWVINCLRSMSGISSTDTGRGSSNKSTEGCDKKLMAGEIPCNAGPSRKAQCPMMRPTALNAPVSLSDWLCKDNLWFLSQLWKKWRACRCWQFLHLQFSLRWGGILTQVHFQHLPLPRISDLLLICTPPKRLI